MDGKVVPTVECGPVKHATVNDVANTVAQTVATETGLMPVAVDHLPMRPGEIPGAQVLADTATLSAVGIDRDSFIPLAQGVQQTVRWFKDNEGTTWHIAAE
jgi:UDP-glucose 4-epimerase